MSVIRCSVCHYGPAEKAIKACFIKHAGSHYLYYHLNDLNIEKFHPSGDLSLKQHAV